MVREAPESARHRTFDAAPEPIISARSVHLAILLTAAEARKLLEAIDVSNVVDLRDRALIGLMAYSFARVSVAIGMRVEDYYGQGKRWGGCAFTKKAASTTKCPVTTISRPMSTPISRRPGSARRRDVV